MGPTQPPPAPAEPRDWSTCPYHASLEGTLREMAASLGGLVEGQVNQGEDIKDILKAQRATNGTVVKLQQREGEMTGAIGVIKWLTVIGIAFMGLIVAAASAGAAYAQLAG